MVSNYRAVLFLDPYAMAVKWETMKAIAATQKIDVWILFPRLALLRLLPKERLPDEKHVRKLTDFFGSDIRSQVYHVKKEDSIFSPSDHSAQQNHVVRKSGDEIVSLYRQNLEGIFAGVADNTLTLNNSKNSPMFDLMFAVGNERGKPIALRIANRILSPKNRLI